MVTRMSKEDPRQAFVRLAEARTNKILKGIELLGNLSNRSNYTFTDDDIKKIFKAINEKTGHVAAKFQAAGASKKRDEFKL
jgi:hypothetical protein